ncbi:MAG: C39 family peptidase [Candidatus Brockarchaeota archaeon]|nr:C39 family peptidase [Candidatus Brockarchaeota archaeon]MBO3808720.1 C39 family peptidase [Candidatus Brockarchaeota archaeon]
MKLKGIILVLLALVLVIILSISTTHTDIPQANYTSRKILSVPFVKQGTDLCSEASASMVLLYYGLNFSQEEINAMGFDRFENMLPFLDKYIYCSYKSLSVEELREEIGKGNPVIIRLRIGISLHTVVAVGYENDWIIAHDPASGPFVLLRVDESFISSWAATNYASIVSRGRKP